MIFPPESLCLVPVHTQYLVSLINGDYFRSLQHIPCGIIIIFHWHNPFGRTMALESTQLILSVALWPWSRLSSGRNEHQEYFLGIKGGRCVGLTTLPPSGADCLKICEPQPPGTLRACPGLYGDCFTLLYSILEGSRNPPLAPYKLRRLSYMNLFLNE
jgi:hypothetical protein